MVEERIEVLVALFAITHLLASTPVSGFAGLSPRALPLVLSPRRAAMTLRPARPCMMADSGGEGFDHKNLFNNAEISKSIDDILNKKLLFPSFNTTNVQTVQNSDTESEPVKPVITVPLDGKPVPITQIRPKMSMIYTCAVCETRQMTTFSRLAYDQGIVIVKCKGCDKRHLIADNLGWYKDWLGTGNKNIEEHMESKGKEARRVTGQEANAFCEEWYDPTAPKRAW